MSEKKLRLDAPKIAISRESASDSATLAPKIYFFFNGFSQFESTRPAGAGAGAGNFGDLSPAAQRAPLKMALEEAGPVTLAIYRQPRPPPP